MKRLLPHETKIFVIAHGVAMEILYTLALGLLWAAICAITVALAK